MKFEWDEEKAESNFQKHGVSFEDASTVFADPFLLVMPDPRHTESRYIVLGRSSSDQVLVVIHAERGDNIRIISARQATPREKRSYVKG